MHAIKGLSAAVFSLALAACGSDSGGGSSWSSASSSSSSSSASSSSSSASSSSASGGQVTQLVIAAGDPGLCHYSGALASEHAGHLAERYIDTANQTGRALLLAVDAEAAGEVDLTLRFANGSGADRPATVRELEAGSEAQFTMEAAGAWTNWVSETRELFLRAGNNLIQVDATTSAGLGNIDRLSVSGTGITAGECPSAGTPGALFPAHGASAANPDTRLLLSFDKPPRINAGTLAIFDAANNTLVDRIDLSGDTDTLGYPGQSSTRELNRVPAKVVGNTVYLSPHTNTLDYGKTYYVVVPETAISGQIDGLDFAGIDAGEWRFSTKASGPSGNRVTVDDNADADFGSVQGALNYVMQTLGKDAHAVIDVRDGLYHEPLYLRDKNNLRIVGESREGTRIEYANSESQNPGSSGRPLFLVQSSDLLSLENLTFHNTHLRNTNGGNGAQAEALYFNSSGRLIAKNAAFISEQDTLLLKGYGWFYHTLVAGNVDFIWGYPNVVLFENSEIRSLGDSKNGGASSAGGYILQARVQSSDNLGFVFLNSTLTRAPGPLGNAIGDGQTYLARSGFSSTSTHYDSFAFINCRMDRHIAAVGWYSEANKPRNPSQGSATFGYREYGSRDMAGNAINLGARTGARILSAGEYSQYYSSRAAIFSSFGGGQGWNPEP